MYILVQVKAVKARENREEKRFKARPAAGFKYRVLSPSFFNILNVVFGIYVRACVCTI